MRKIILILILLLFSFCKRENGLPRLNFSGEDKYIEVNSKEMLRSTPPTLAFNFTHDTITILKDRYVIDDRFSVMNRDSLSKIIDFKIFVDTSYHFVTKGIAYKNIQAPIPSDPYHTQKFEKLYDKYYKDVNVLKNTQLLGLPLLIYNNSNTAAIVDDPSDMMSEYKVIQEAMDTDGKWKPIEFHYNFSGCGFGDVYKKFLPKHYMALGLIKYKGNFKTKLRVKFSYRYQIYYSNEFYGTINRSQFDNKPAFNCCLFYGRREEWPEIQKEMFLNSSLKGK